jgi:hypothetical protein
VTFTIPNGDEQYFLNPLQVYFGTQNNGLNSIGESILLMNINISGPEGTNMDDFANGKNWSDNWLAVENGGSQATHKGLWAVPQNIAYWINWTTPAVGFDLEVAPYLKPDPALGHVPWVMPAYYNSFTTQLVERLEGWKYWTFITTNVLDAMMNTYPDVVSNAFFRLDQPPRSSP